MTAIQVYATPSDKETNSCSEQLQTAKDDVEKIRVRNYGQFQYECLMQIATATLEKYGLGKRKDNGEKLVNYYLLETEPWAYIAPSKKLSPVQAEFINRS